MVCGVGYIYIHCMPAAAPYLDYADGQQGLNYLLLGQDTAEIVSEICL